MDQLFSQRVVLTVMAIGTAAVQVTVLGFGEIWPWIMAFM